MLPGDTTFPFMWLAAPARSMTLMGMPSSDLVVLHFAQSSVRS